MSELGLRQTRPGSQHADLVPDFGHPFVDGVMRCHAQNLLGRNHQKYSEHGLAMNWVRT